MNNVSIINGIPHKYARNAIFNVIGFLITVPIILITTRYILRMIGEERFGIWALASVVTSFVQLSNLGIGTALVKFVSESWTNTDTKSLNKTVNTVFFTFIFTAGTVATILMLSKGFVVNRLLKIPLEFQSEATFVITGIIIIFFFNLIFSVYNSILLGIQRMDITNGIVVFSRILWAFGIFFFLSKNFGLRGLIINNGIVSFFTICANIFWTKRIIKKLTINPFLFSFREFKRIIKYSLNIFIATLTGIAQNPLNKVILSNFVSLPSVTFYEIGLRIQMMVRGVFQVGLSPLLPASSELNSLNNYSQIEELYLKTSRVLLLIAFPVFLLLIVIALPLTNAWLGEGYEMAGRAIQFLLIGHFFSLLITPQYIILQGIGKPQLSAIIAITAGGLNALISILLARSIGYYGVLIGISSSLIFASILAVFLFHETMGFSFIKYLKNMSFQAIIVGFVSVAPIFYFSHLINFWNLPKLLFISIIFFLIYGLIIVSGFVGNEDKKILVSLIRNFRLKGKYQSDHRV